MVTRKHLAFGVAGGALLTAGSAHAALPADVQTLLDMADASSLTAFFVGIGTVAVTAVLITHGVRWVKSALGMMPGR
jgi:hypothetical protein